MIFDTNRGWTTKLPALVELFPAAKVICCVRNPAMILDSVESLVRRNAYELSGIFNFDSGGTVYSRVEGLASPAGMFGFSYNALREAVYGEQSDRLLIVRYESMVGNPLGTLAAIYGFIGEELYPHDPRHIEPCYDMIEFDLRLGTPGLHDVGRVVEAQGAQADPAAGPPRALPEGRVLGGPQATAADRQARLPQAVRRPRPPPRRRGHWQPALPGHARWLQTRPGCSSATMRARELSQIRTATSRRASVVAGGCGGRGRPGDRRHVPAGILIELFGAQGGTGGAAGGRGGVGRRGRCRGITAPPAEFPQQLLWRSRKACYALRR